MVDEDFTFLKSSQCEITEKHIAEMYDRFESGLCDQATCNAVALALSERIGAKARVYRRNGKAMLDSLDGTVELPGIVHQWLDAVDRGIPATPFQFEIELNQ